MSDPIVEKLENFPAIKLATYKKQPTPGPALHPSQFANVPRSSMPETLSRPDGEALVAGRCVSTYPSMGGAVLADPICDTFFFQDLDTRLIFGMYDGCSLGNRTKDAAHRASGVMMEYLSEALAKAKDLKSVGQVLLKSFYKAHDDILKHESSENTTVPGATFAGVGVLSQLKVDKGSNKWALVCAVLGNIKLFHLSKSGKFRDLTRDPNQSLKGLLFANSSFGRIGGDSKEPDMTGIRLICLQCGADDQFLVSTKGFWGNHIPEIQGKTPEECSIEQCDSWENASYSDIESSFLESIQEFWTSTTPLTSSLSPNASSLAALPPDSLPAIVNRLVDSAFEMTDGRREDQTSLSSPQSNFDKWPGYIEHTSLLLFRLPSYGPKVSSKPTPMRSASQRISRSEAMGVRPVAKLIETEWILDKSLQQLMNHYYYHLASHIISQETPMSRAAALRQAQLDIREMYPIPSYRFGENFLPNEDTLSTPNIKMQFWKSSSQQMFSRVSTSLVLDDSSEPIPYSSSSSSSSSSLSTSTASVPTPTSTNSSSMTIPLTTHEEEEASDSGDESSKSSLSGGGTGGDVQDSDAKVMAGSPSVPQLHSSGGLSTSSNLSPSSTSLSLLPPLPQGSHSASPKHEAATIQPKKKKGHNRAISIDADMASEIRKKKSSTLKPESKDKKNRLGSLFGSKPSN